MYSESAQSEPGQPLSGSVSCDDLALPLQQLTLPTVDSVAPPGATCA